MFKRLLDKKFVQRVLAGLIAAYMRFVRASTRWQMEGLEVLEPLQKSGKGFIVCAWHGRFMMALAGWSEMPQTPYVLISKSRDGNLVALTSRKLKLGVVRGSRKAKHKDKHKRGAGALREMVAVLENGDCIFMTPDGPKGPRMVMGEGPIRLAKLSGAPLIAFGLATNRHKVFKSWDRFMLPLPFGRGKIIFAGPVCLSKNANAEAQETARTTLETLLNQASQNCDKAVGLTPPILPDTQDKAR